MGRRFTGAMTGAGLRIAIIDTRWNDFIVERLVAGAVDELVRHGVSEEAIDRVTVPGAFELPLTVKTVCESGRYDAVVALGCVIRGATPHFDYVAGEAAKGVAAAANASGVPAAFGVLTTDTIEQAIERAGTKTGNKGAEAALVALEMANLLKTLKEA
ncbi:MAG: 6,7-dimethyl-8-ribityllumazine synthase [Pseudomonadota bacterium]